MNLPWWKTGIIYQIYPRSFADSNDDGIGDLAGITARLDYLLDLGVDAIWLSPIYPSPDADFGYDISDYTGVDPKFGSLDDFDRLVQAAHVRGIHIVMDMVLNHTSDQHPWFLQSSSAKDNPYRDWYIWADPKPGGGPPNNWQSVFGGPGWEFHPDTGQYYYHMFTKEQPDVNWHNPAVRRAMLDGFRFWLERGVDGFRLDVFNVYFKDKALRSNPVRFPLPLFSFFGQQHLYDMHRPEMIPLLQDLRVLLDAYSVDGRECYAVGEAFVSSPKQTASYIGADRLHAAFNFEFLGSNLLIPAMDWSAQRFSAAVLHWEHALGPESWPNYVLNNHDQVRSATRFRAFFHDSEDDARLKVAAALLLTLRGTPFLYYGEEIGMRDIPIRSREEVLDPVGKTFWPFMKGRDGCRSPMQWDGTPGAGFTGTKVRPWLPLNPDYISRNVEAQRANPRSLYNFYRQLIAVRRSSPALLEGMYQPLTFGTRYLFAYLRATNQQTVLVALNLSGRRKRLVLGSLLAHANFRLLLSSTRDTIPPIHGGMLPLEPYEAVVIEVSQG
jgi:alpha-glucosidase